MTGTPSTPAVIVFDVNETLSDMSAMADRFSDIGLQSGLAKLWFASLLRDGFARTAAGESEEFSRLGAGSLRVLLSTAEPNCSENDAVAHVMDGLADLQAHPDVADGARALRRLGLRLVTLTNGSAQVAETLFAKAGIRKEFEHLLSVVDAGVWKPARGAYEYAAATCGVDVGRMLLVAVHPWDIDGAARAGMSTAWINRTGGAYPEYFCAPTYSVAELTDLPALLAR